MTVIHRESGYAANADYWVRIIREERDRFRTELTDAAVLAAAGPVSGRSVLDAGCGEGYLSRSLAERGARVTGVDACRELIEAAQEPGMSDGMDVTYETADVAALPLPDESFDLVVASHLLNDLEEPAGALREFARVLRPGGRLVALMLHPCFYTDAAASSPAGYFRPRRVEKRFLVAGLVSPVPVVAWLRPLEDYIGRLTAAGFCLTGLSEPHPSPERLRDDPWWRESYRRPLFMLLTAARTGR